MDSIPPQNTASLASKTAALVMCLSVLGFVIVANHYSAQARKESNDRANRRRAAEARELERQRAIMAPGTKADPHVSREAALRALRGLGGY